MTSEESSELFFIFIFCSTGGFLDPKYLRNLDA